MKVVHLVPAMQEGGVESVVLNLNRMLTQAGHKSVVIARGGKLVARLEADGGRHLSLDLKAKNPLTYFWRAGKLRRVLKAEKPDLVCVHSRVPAWLFAWANRSLKLPFVSYAHGANSVSRYSAVMTRGNAVVVPSKFLGDYLLDNYPESPNLAARLRIIPNGIDLTRFDPENLDAAFIADRRDKWGLKAGDFVTMSVGRITKLKGFDAVIRDFAAGQADKLVIVGGADRGKEELLASLKALAQELGVAERVIFAGAETKMPECLSLASEVVSGNMTKPETFGLSVVEAYAMNRPVRVLRKFGGVAEVMDAVAAANKPTLREAVAELYGNERLAQQTLALYSQQT